MATHSNVSEVPFYRLEIDFIEREHAFRVALGLHVSDFMWGTEKEMETYLDKAIKRLQEAKALLKNEASKLLYKTAPKSLSRRLRNSTVNNLLREAHVILKVK